MGLGFFRLVLSLWVIDHHYNITGKRVLPRIEAALGTDNLGYLGIGHIAVISFFVLSGYVITWVLKNKYPHNQIGIQTFFVGRFLRIYPLYWGILAVFIGLLVLMGLPTGLSIYPQLSLWRIIGDLLLIPYGFAGFFLESNHYVYGMIDLPAWTLPYDLVFYLFAPWLVMQKRFLGWIIGLELLYMLVLALISPDSHWHGWYLSTGHAQLLAFSVGAMAWHYRQLVIPLWCFVAAIAGLLYLVFVPFMLTSIYTNHLLVILLTVVIVLGAKKRSALDNLFGELTYSTYLLHLPVLVMLLIMDVDTVVSLIAVVITYVLSFLVVKYVENPLEKMRARITERSLKTAAGLPEEHRSSGRYLKTALLAFILLSAGYNVNWLYTKGVPQIDQPSTVSYSENAEERSKGI